MISNANRPPAVGSVALIVISRRICFKFCVLVAGNPSVLDIIQYAMGGPKRPRWAKNYFAAGSILFEKATGELFLFICHGKHHQQITLEIPFNNILPDPSSR